MLDRKDPMVQAWINNYRKASAWSANEDCRHCGFPHSKNVATCNMATWGSINFGQHTFYISNSNAEAMALFLRQPRSGFHWRDGIYFDRTEVGVSVSRVEAFNNTPHIKEWLIPWNEWASVVKFAAGAAPTQKAQQPIQAHSKSQYKRLSALGANVVPRAAAAQAPQQPITAGETNGKRSTSAATASGHELPNAGESRTTAIVGPEGATDAVANGGDARVASAGSPAGVAVPVNPSAGEPS